MRRSLMRYAVLFGLGIVTAPICLSAQSKPPEPGDVLRITTKPQGARVTGKLVSLDGQSFVLEHEPANQGSVTFNRQPSTIPFSSILKAEVSRGRPDAGRRILGGTLLGILAGGVSAGFIGYKTSIDCDCEYPGLGVLWAFPAALVGGLVGGGIGYARSPDKWEPVAIPTPVQ